MTNKQLTIFEFSSPLAIGVIDEGAFTVTIDFPFGTNVTALVALFSHTGEDVEVDPGGGRELQTSGVSVNDFSSPVTYYVIAEDTSEQAYVVTVNVASTPDGNEDPVEWQLVDTNMTSILSIIPAV